MSKFEVMCARAKSLVDEGATRDKDEFNADKDLVVMCIRKERDLALQQCEKPYNTFLNEVKQVSLRSHAETNRTRIDDALEKLQGALDKQSTRYTQKADAVKEIRAGKYAPSESSAFIDDTSVDGIDVLYVSSSSGDDVASSDSVLSDDLSVVSSDDDEEGDELLEFESSSDVSSSADDDEESQEESLGKRKRAKDPPPPPSPAPPSVKRISLSDEEE
jgi:hypothetical protein